MPASRSPPRVARNLVIRVGRTGSAIDPPSLSGVGLQDSDGRYAKCGVLAVAHRWPAAAGSVLQLLAQLLESPDCRPAAAAHAPEVLHRRAVAPGRRRVLDDE